MHRTGLIPTHRCGWGKQLGEARRRHTAGHSCWRCPTCDLDLGAGLLLQGLHGRAPAWPVLCARVVWVVHRQMRQDGRAGQAGCARCCCWMRRSKRRQVPRK